VMKERDGEAFKREAGAWLNGWDWDMWGTVEFNREWVVSDTINAKRYFRRWIEDLHSPGSTISYFMAVERFKDNVRTHIHFLLKGVGDRRYAEVGAPWWDRYKGYAWITKYDPLLGANHYITKYITKTLCDWDFDLKKVHQLTLFKAVEISPKAGVHNDARIG